MTVGSQEITTVINIVNHSMFSISKMLRTAVSLITLRWKCSKCTELIVPLGNP